MASSAYDNQHLTAYAWGENEGDYDEDAHDNASFSSMKIDDKQNQLKTRDYKNTQEQYTDSFTNISYVNDDDENREVADFIKLVAKKGKQAMKLHKKWDKFKTVLEGNQDEVKVAIEQRRKDLIRTINQSTDVALKKVDGLFSSQSSSVLNHQEILGQRLHELDSLLNEREKFTASKIRKYKKRLAHICQENDSEHLTMIPEWQTVKLETRDSKADLFGAISGGLLKHEAWAEDEMQIKDDDAIASDVDDTETGNLFLPQPVLHHSFSIKHSKDKRDVGVSDVAVNSKGNILVVDKHNKTVKVFAASGKFLHFVGRHQIKEPSRVSVIDANDSVLVTDNHSKTVILFQEDGMILGTFVQDLVYPSDHCLRPDGNEVAVLDYGNGTVNVYDLDGCKTMSFHSGLQSAAYICSTQRGGYVVTDWRNQTLAIFSHDGTMMHSIQDQISGQLNQPHGVTSDLLGHVIVAGHSNHRVQVFSGDGSFLWCFDGSDDTHRASSAASKASHASTIVTASAQDGKSGTDTSPTGSSAAVSSTVDFESRKSDQQKKKDKAKLPTPSSSTSSTIQNGGTQYIKPLSSQQQKRSATPAGVTAPSSMGSVTSLGSLGSLGTVASPSSLSSQYIKPLMSQQQQEGRMRLPTALACHPSGLLVVCDYQGRVRLFKYMDHELNTDFEISGKKAHKKSTAFKHNRVQQEDGGVEETTC